MAHGCLNGPVLAAGTLRARLASGTADVAHCLGLRARLFRGGRADADGFDPACRHVMIEAEGGLVGTCRLLKLADGSEIEASYSAQFYGLDRLMRYKAPMIELGRFCIAPEAEGGDALRLAWGLLTRIVDGEGIGMLLGCSSFAGTNPGAYRDAFALIGARHLAPPAWRPTEKAPDVYRFAALERPDPKRALKAMPPLLRSYLGMGGRVSDHAVIDRDMGTLHVFTGLEIAAVPAARARALRALAAGN